MAYDVSASQYDTKTIDITQPCINPIPRVPSSISVGVHVTSAIDGFDWKQYKLVTARKVASSIEEAMVMSVSKNIESVFAAKGASVTNDTRLWIKRMVREVLKRIVAEL